MSLLQKLRKNSVIDSEILSQSKYFTKGKVIPTRIPILNVALTSSLDGGLTPGVTMIAAPPKHFKSNLMLELMASFQEHCDLEDKDHFIVLYDSEFGTNISYYEQAGIDTTKIDHRPIPSIELLTTDLVNLLNDIEAGDNVLICIDSLGNTPSEKAIKDAEDGNHKVDMTMAKLTKNLFRLITTKAIMKEVPIVVVNHSYQTIETYSKEVASGGRGAQFAAHTLFFITKANEKEGEDKVGFTFTVRAGLSRQVKQDSKFPLLVTYSGGIYKYSGLFDLAEEFGYVSKKSQGWYWLDPERTKAGRRSEVETGVFMEKLLKNEKFKKDVENHYRVSALRLSDEVKNEEEKPVDKLEESSSIREYKLKK